MLFFSKTMIFLSFPVVVPPNVYSTTLKKKKKSSGPGKKGQKKEEKSKSQLLAMLHVRAVCHDHQECLAVCEGMC